jgi:DEAD/DEAH box helicase domain-containing protein
MDAAWEEAAACASAGVQHLLPVLFVAGISAPDVGYELLGADGRVVADAELAWPDQRAVVLLPDADDSAFVAAGWCVWRATDTGLAAQIIDFLK